MDIVVAIIQVVAIFGVPLLLLNLRNWGPIKLIGMVGSAYAICIVVSLIVFGLNKLGVDFSLNSDIGEIGSYLAIGIAIPLLLFSTNLKEIRKLSKNVLVSFGCLIIALFVVTTVVFFLFKDVLANSEIFSGMAMGLYTGGTPNLNAIGNILGLDGNSIALANLSDMMIGGVFYVFLLLAAKPLLSKILKQSSNEIYLKEDSDITNYESLEKVPLKNAKKVFFSIMLSVLMAVCSALVGVVVWFALGAVQGRMMDYVVPCLLIGVTVFGIIGSFNKNIREVEGNNLVGQYLILVFSFALSSCLDLTRLGAGFIYILLFFGIITIGTFILHVILAKIFKIDVDCMLITLTAGVYGPAFVPAIASQLKKDDLVAPGLIVGSLGYAIGTFLGLLVALLFGIFI